MRYKDTERHTELHTEIQRHKDTLIQTETCTGTEIQTDGHSKQDTYINIDGDTETSDTEIQTEVQRYRQTEVLTEMERYIQIQTGIQS